MTENSIIIHHNFNGTEEISYIELSEIPKGVELINKYKVVAPRIVTRNSINALNKASVLRPNEICTQHWSVIGSFDSVTEAQNLVTYIKCKLFQFIVWMNCSEGVTGLSKVLLDHVPLVDLSKVWKDQDLYQLFNLTPEEIDYIEKTIKPM